MLNSCFSRLCHYYIILINTILYFASQNKCITEHVDTQHTHCASNKLMLYYVTPCTSFLYTMIFDCAMAYYYNIHCILLTTITKSAQYQLASYPGRKGGGRKAAWYLMFAHAPKLPRKLVIVYSP